MNPKNELVIRINPDDRRMMLESSDNGLFSCKEISPEQLMEALRGSMKKERIRTGLLPPNCFHMDIDSDGCKRYCIWHPERYEDISYYGTEYPHFPLPRLVFGFLLTPEGKVQSCDLGVIADEQPTLETQMFYYPFSNVGGFHLCTGSNTLPVYKKIHTLSTLPGYLLRLPNNNDSYSMSRNKLQLPYRELLNHLKNKDPSYYYTDILVSSGKCLKDFIDRR